MSAVHNLWHIIKAKVCDIQEFIESLSLPSVAFTFDELLEEDWDPTENPISLASLN